MQQLSTNLITKLTFIILILYAVSVNINAQINKLAIGPVGLLDPVTPSINIHVESKISANYRLDVAYGFDPNFALWASWHPAPDGRHHEFKTCFQRIMQPANESSTELSYYGIELFAVWDDYEKFNDQYIQNGERYIYDRAAIYRDVRGFRFKLGYEKSWAPTGIEIYMGLGLRHVSLVYETVNEQIAGELWQEYDFMFYNDNPRSKYNLDVNLGIKLFFLFEE